MKNITRTLLSLAVLALSVGSASAQAPITAVGIIGTATPGGWNTDTDMTQTTATSHIWTVTMALTAAEAKFRANHDWTTNWGDTAFPTGTGTNNGPNIPITAGTYRITLNDQSGAYTFASPTATRNADAAILALTLAPNPGRETNVMYNLPTASTVNVAVLNALGQTVRQLPAARQEAGVQKQALNLAGLAAGVYMVRLNTGTYTQTSRLVVE